MALLATALFSHRVDAAQIFVPSGASIRDAVAIARPGDEIVLQAGGTYTETITLPDKGGVPITIRTSAQLPERRIGPADRALLPSIGSGNSMAPMTVAGSNWRLVGLEFRSNTFGQGNVIDVVGSAANVVIDRVLIEGGEYGQKRAISMNGGGAITVSRSYLANIWKSGQESQALAAWNCPGPFTIRDNYLEAASVNIMFGGADSSTQARMPADILVEGNHLTKQTVWQGSSGYVVKNLLELKAARRVVVRNNLMENNWADGQAGWALMLTPRNQDGRAPWSVIEDVLFEGNVIRATPRGINITGRDDLNLSAQTRRVTFRNNVFVTQVEWLMAAGEIGELTLDHNTVMNGGTLIKFAISQIHEGNYTRQSQFAVGSLTVHNSLMQHGANGYGIWGENSGMGTLALANYTHSSDVRRNVIAGENGWQTPYPTDTLQPGYAEHLANFITPTYELRAGSAYRGAALDGADLGARFAGGSTSTPVPPDVEPAETPASLPAPWRSQDVGSVSIAGRASAANGSFAVTASGADVWGRADALHYVWQPVRGDVDIVARVASIGGVHAWTKAGVMIRGGFAANDTQAFMLASPGKGLAFQRRVTTDNFSTHTAGGDGTAPVWVKLERRGATITAFRSADGATWTFVGTDSFAIPDEIFVGLALSSHDDARAATATFDNVSVRSVGASTTPTSWTSQDIGSVGVSGSASEQSGGTVVVRGSGADVWDTADGLHYRWQAVRGDVDIVARVASVEYVHRWTKAGVMIRGDLSAGAAQAFMLVSAGRGTAFQRRLAPGDLSLSTSDGSGTAPMWVKLERRGNTIRAYQSSDGSNWALVGSDDFAMSEEAYVGVAVTSHDNSRLATASFSGVVIRRVP